MNLLSVGLNYTTAPLDLRAKVAFPPEQIGQAIAAARAWFGRHAGPADASEAAILSTCNRTELYAARPAAGGIDAEIDAAAQFLAHYHKLPYAELRPHLYALPRDHAVRHAFRVASGLDSMVLGEAQILGQMKEAVRLADAGGGLGTYLHQLFQRTFAVAKEVRTRTQIGAHSVSMAGAAVRMAQRIFPTIESQRILFIGAGEMIELCLAHFAAHNPLSITVANRTLERAESLAQRYHGKAIGLGDVPRALACFDIVVSCTGSATPLIERQMVERALKARLRKPIFMVDLAVPRDIDSAVGDLADVFLYTVDDLGAVVQSGRALRQTAVEQAETIIETRVQAYMQWADQRAVVPVIQDLHASSETIRCAELQRARKMLARGDDIEAVMAALSQGLTAKFLNGPQQVLRRSRGAERAHLVRVLPQLFRAHA